MRRTLSAAVGLVRARILPTTAPGTAMQATAVWSAGTASALARTRASAPGPLEGE
jgi:hypothetical protein